MAEKFGRFLRQHVLFFSCLFMTLLILIFCLLTAEAYWKRIERDFGRETANIARLLATDFDTTIRHVDGLLLNIASEYALLDKTSPDFPFQLHRMLKSHLPAGSSPIAFMGISDKNGMVIATSDIYPVPQTDISQSDTFRVQAQKPSHDALYISEPHVGRLSKQQVILISRPLKSDTGDFGGVVAASYKLEDFIQLIGRLDVQDVGFVGMVGRDGVIRVRLVAGQLSYGSRIRVAGPLMSRIEHGEKEGSFLEESILDHKKRFGYFATSQVSPMIVYVGYDYSYLENEYYHVIILLAAFWLVFSIATFGALFLFQRIGRLTEQRKLALLEATAAERQTILAQMHDSIGSSLAVLISHLDHATDWSGAKQTATQILTELRFLIDSVSDTAATLNVILASVRHRMASGLEHANLKLNWAVEELPNAPTLSAQCALHLRLMLKQALTNVMQHARARSVTVSASYDKAAKSVTISVTDDGCGFDTMSEPGGHGIQNIRARAKKITLPTVVDIDSKPGKGTRVRIKIEWPVESPRLASSDV